jgi:oxygen-dependent protoporphyrinogen oxidase
MFKSSFRLGLALSLGVALGACTASIADQPAETESTESELRVVLGRKSHKIAIVGAGPSGLTAADTLRARGYTNVTVFEREAQVGGKVNTLRTAQGNTELGAVFASPDYTLTLDYAKKYNVPYENYVTTRWIMDENGRQTNESFVAGHFTPEEAQAGGLKYLVTTLAFFQTNLNGFVLYHPDLKLPFVQFAEKHGIEPITELMRSIMVGFGYPYYEDAPAMYYMKLISWLIKFDPEGALSGGSPLKSAQYFTFPTGFQSVWQAVADSGLNVKLNSTVTNIVRRRPRLGQKPIEITINGTDKYEFDEVIISAPLNRVDDFMTLSAKEAELFQFVESERYVVTLFTSANLPRSEVVFFHTNSFPDRINHVVAWGSRDATPVNIGYQIADRTTPINAVTGVLAADVAAEGGVYGSTLFRKEWEDYFPHVRFHATGEPGEKVAPSNFYDQVELMQGDNNTFYVGGTLSFETVEHSARYAKQMVETHFLPAVIP